MQGMHDDAIVACGRMRPNAILMLLEPRRRLEPPVSSQLASDRHQYLSKRESTKALMEDDAISATHANWHGLVVVGPATASGRNWDQPKG